ncbi:hypothetical protein [Mycolicibacterium sp. P1-18]|uniref:hypothetical protein n=1 Tax=Mycolicibacterium sp. P1-18 TaxID=2024615 RepID=UPI0011F2D66E|nr:hypothetical protein [Mycolicibacterium sp. P1-18]
MPGGEELKSGVAPDQPVDHVLPAGLVGLIQRQPEGTVKISRRVDIIDEQGQLKQGGQVHPTNMAVGTDILGRSINVAAAAVQTPYW